MQFSSKRFSSDRIRSYSDERLINAVLHRERYGYPFDYVQACREELYRRGYSSEEIERFAQEDADRPERFDLRRQIEVRRAMIILLLGASVLLLAVVFLTGEAAPPAVRQVLGGMAVAFLCFAFLAYAHRTILQGRLARLNATDNPASDN